MDMVAVTCPKCGMKLKIRSASGKFVSSIRCPKCANKFPLPANPDAAAPNVPVGASPAPQGAGQPSPVSVPQPVSPATAQPAQPVTSQPPRLTAADAAPAKISFSCTGCRRDLTISREMAGKSVKCKNCGAILTVPSASTRTAPEPAPVIPAPVAGAQAPQPAPAPQSAPPPQSSPVPQPSPAPQPSPVPRQDIPVAEVDRNGELRALKTDLFAYYTTEIEAAERRLADLKSRLARLVT